MSPAKAPVMAAFVPLLASSQAAGPEPPGERCSPAEGAIQEGKEEDEERSGAARTRTFPVQIGRRRQHSPHLRPAGWGLEGAAAGAEGAGGRRGFASAGCTEGA